MKKVELLAPAGNYESFLGAIHAGADAVYLGGRRFGARAYAGNFTEEEICRAVRHAHIYGKKVYLTVNTLMKEREIGDVYDYLLPLYQVGLDGVIIQDMGVFSAVGRWFPGLERHISTQMSVTGAYSAALLKDLGAVRIVPARELSLEEIKQIKQISDIEIETFIHGAVCYSYSGQCLFSSILGGRSGNRGRCAQPCRLPYEISIEGKTVKKGTYYPLSLKDMCTIEILPQLIEAGIDSFKIEGRMKSPEYAAGVTAIYRKYIDRYYKNKEAPYHVAEEDMEKLASLYLRSKVSTGYYEKHNGKAMITLDNPSYAKCDDRLAASIREKFLQGDYRLPVNGKVSLYKGCPACFELSYEDITVKAEGEIAAAALKQPLTKESVLKQIGKSGNTCFVFKHLVTDMEQDVFLTVKALNELRRMAFEKLENKIIHANGLDNTDRKVNDKDVSIDTTIDISINLPQTHLDKRSGLSVSVQTKEQLVSVMDKNLSKIYVSSDLLIKQEEAVKLLAEVKSKNLESSLYLSLPYIVRLKDKKILTFWENLLKEEFFTGVLVRNYEEIAWLKECSYSGQIESDANLYLFNKNSYDMYGCIFQERYLPFELNYAEITGLLNTKPEGHFSQIVYGRIPMMVTANCIAKTMDECRRRESGRFGMLTDRYRKTFPVYMNCRHCYNVIYNSVPLSLHQSITKLKKAGIVTFRLDFTTEDGKKTEQICTFFEKLLSGNEKKEDKVPFLEYTNGHFKRGVE